ncbi:hypothetical protein [Clostridium aceticum]|nr:hypothetical protein [Clostridium aceticum]
MSIEKQGFMQVLKANEAMVLLTSKWGRGRIPLKSVRKNVIKGGME